MFLSPLCFHVTLFESYKLRIIVLCFRVPFEKQMRGIAFCLRREGNRITVLPSANTKIRKSLISFDRE